MIITGRKLENGSTLEADTVVIGAGPAGIVTALELAGAGMDVILLESGEWKPDPRVEELGEVELLDAGRHAPSSLTTRRQIGGTSAIWGGRCVPFDPIDFESRDIAPSARWPLHYEELPPYFQRACDWLMCGRAVFDAAAVPTLSQSSLVPGLRDGAVRSSSLERWSLPANLGREFADQLRASTKVRLVTAMTCTGIVPDVADSRVDHITARALDGRTVHVRARSYVVACGGLESTRLLLASRTSAGRAIGNHSGHLGRWYMAHLEGAVAQVHFGTPPRATQYSYARDIDGVYVRRRLSFDADYLREHRLPNIVGWLANANLPDAAHRSGALSAAYLALVSPAGRWFAPDAQRRSLTGEHVPGAPYGMVARGSPRAHLRNLAVDLPSTLRFVFGFGAARFLSRRRIPGFFAYSPANTYPLQYHGEHLPHWSSRVWLNDRRNPLGMPQLRIDLRFSDEDIDGVVRAHSAWDEYLRSSGIGELRYHSADVPADVWKRAGGGFHQSGTTRMSARPDDGVVDANLAVHGMDNLFVASSSTFVTSSQANSTFMIVVFALRLVDHLKRVYRR